MSMKPSVLKSRILGFALLISLASLPVSGQGISSFSALADGDQAPTKPLSQEQAFPYFVSVVDPDTLRLTWQPAAEHYLYKRAFKFTYHSSETAEPEQIDFLIPAGIAKTDEFFGEVEVYFDLLEIELDLPKSGSPDGYIVIEYQGCAEWGFCYPPQRNRFPL